MTMLKEQPENNMSRNKLVFSLTMLLVMLAVAGFVAWQQRTFARAEVVIDERIKIAADVASTPATREKGLSGREALGAAEGMLFIFGRADRYAFWMKDMRFAIDILWIKGDEIVDITTDVPPAAVGAPLERYFPMSPIDKVLEVSAGFAARHGLRTGLKLTINIDKVGAER
ncbi:MAG: DUF192 domain-containing protein [Patescibacteria group bacterium]|jgi:hypothetical protein